MNAEERLSYKDFKELLLIELVLSVEGDIRKTIKGSELSPRIRGAYNSSWVAEAARQLKSEGLANLNQFGGESFLGITGRGLEKADEYGTKHGFPELDEEIAERRATAPEPATVAIDRTSELFKEMEAEILAAIQHVRSSNLLPSYGPEASQIVAELEAGKKLLEAEQIDRSLANRLLVEPLRWLTSKSLEEVVKVAVQTALKAAAAYFGFKIS